MTGIIFIFVLRNVRRFDEFYPDGMYPVLAHTEHFGRTVGQINYAVLWHRPAVVYADDYRPVILQISNPDPRAERQGAVCRSELIHVEWLAAGSSFVLEEPAVP